MLTTLNSQLVTHSLTSTQIDAQAGVAVGGGVYGGGPHVTGLYHASMERSTKETFGNNTVINCMCHSTENLYRMEGTTVARASDDFWPRDPNSAGTCA